MRTLLIRRGATAILAAGAVRTARHARDRIADRRFMQVDPRNDTVHELGSLRLCLPATWHRTDGFIGYWAADLDAVKALLPSDRIHPVRTDRDHGLVGVFAFRHFESAARSPDGATLSLPAYGEAGVYLAVTRRPLPPLLPLVLQWAADAPLGGYVLTLPVTARFHRDGGRALWGFPKFLADMEFTDDGTSRSVHVSEGGEPILDLQVEGRGPARLSRASSVMYSVRDDRLLETVCPSRTFTQRAFRGSAEVTLGDHPAARGLQELGISGAPIATGIVQQQRFLMPAGRDLGPARRSPWYEGRDAENGSFITRHADGSVIDHMRETAGSMTRRSRDPSPAR